MQMQTEPGTLALLKGGRLSVAIAEEITIGENCASPKSLIIISTAKNAPAMGALNAAAIPAAAPQPTKVFNL